MTARRAGLRIGVARGAYILADAADGNPAVVLLATGSEGALCVTAFQQLNADGIKAHVLSILPLAVAARPFAE